MAPERKASIDPDLWRRLSPLLDEMLDLDAAGRTARLAALQAADPALAAHLEAFMAPLDGTGEAPLLDASAITTAGERPAEALSLEGVQVGTYIIEAPLGSGGSGTVWRARRADERIGGVVAIKLLHLSMVDQAARRRFAREGAILARLMHPHIARLLDAGVTSLGQPYLVLDLVAGEPIDRYCDEHCLSVDERLALFDEVLAAVAHAHSHLIVHRDIKPSNILVGPDGRVRLLDFGIAKLLEEGAHNEQMTADGQRLLTPQYAAPEQLEGAAITTATDIYALGVLLYELLAGQHPISPQAASQAEVIRLALEADPTSLPRALTPSAARPRGTIDKVAAARATTPERLRRRLAGDLENIVARMLRRDPAERYQTAAALADDLGRYRRDEPVSARPDAVVYRLSKFARRHRAMVGAAAVVLLSLTAGLAGTITQARRAEAAAARARAERDHAIRQLSYAESSNEFITFLLDQAGPDKPLMLIDLLGRGETLVATQFADDAATRARLQMHLSGLYAQSGQNDKAAALLAAAEEAARDVPDPTLHATIECGTAWQVSEKGSADLAIEMIDRALARLDAWTDQDVSRSSRAECLFGRGQVRFARGDLQAAATDLRQALATLGQPRTDQRTLAIRIRSTLALTLYRLNHPAPAVAEYERVLAELDALGRGETSLAATLSNNLSVILSGSGQLLRAHRASARAFGIVRSAGTGDPIPESVFAKLLTELGRPAEALPFAERAIASTRESGNDRVKAIALQNGAVTFCALEQLTRCDALLAEAHALLARTLPAGSTAIAGLRVQQAELALARDDAREAARLLTAALEAYDAAQPQRGPGVLPGLILLARAEHRIGELAAARRHADEAVAVARAVMAGFAHSRWLGGALLARGLVQQASGDRDGARESWREALVELEHSAGETAPLTVEARRLLAGA